MRTLVLHRDAAAQGPLLLVNSSHPLSPKHAPELTAPDSRFPHIRLERQAACLLSACIQAAGGTGGIVPVSGWRSQEEQQTIWDSAWSTEGEAFTRRYVARPGCSEHQTGLAIDLAERAEHIDFIRPAFPDRGPCGAFRRLAAEYGFLQRYRTEKTSLTGIAAEPWHFRYVGVPHARLMEENGLCLEEYAAFLDSGPKLCTLPNGRNVRVSRLPCPDAQVETEVPEGCCQVSGDNQGGFILTLWGDRP